MSKIKPHKKKRFLMKYTNVAEILISRQIKLEDTNG